ncbi:hypothetical protein CLV70_101587 [Pseudosporangium ferrugineum]|uniref:Uncharacterized protein n=1 Tax=Pseudosporangium ferrugineum TaxID=439699 RepID=A0A2T0SJ48_9ACTN|nr:hypothetical protein CLV70_101587 [Pseudosporangium ferrugineum]
MAGSVRHPPAGQVHEGLLRPGAPLGRTAAVAARDAHAPVVRRRDADPRDPQRAVGGQGPDLGVRAVAPEDLDVVALERQGAAEVEAEPARAADGAGARGARGRGEGRRRTGQQHVRDGGRGSRGLRGGGGGCRRDRCRGGDARRGRGGRRPGTGHERVHGGRGGSRGRRPGRRRGGERRQADVGEGLRVAVPLRWQGGDQAGHAERGQQGEAPGDQHQPPAGSPGAGGRGAGAGRDGGGQDHGGGGVGCRAGPGRCRGVRRGRTGLVAQVRPDQQRVRVLREPVRRPVPCRHLPPRRRG